MELDVHTIDGGNLHVEDFDPSGVMDLLDNLRDGELLTFALNDGMAYIPAAAVTRIDVTD